MQNGLAAAPFSYVSGPVDAPLLDLTLGQLLEQAADAFGDDKTYVVFVQQSIRRSFRQVLQEV